MSHRVEVSRRAEKALGTLRDLSLRRRLMEAIRALGEAPRPPGCVKLAGAADLWRVRVGEWRIIYQIQDRALVVLVLDVGNRRDIYR